MKNGANLEMKHHLRIRRTLPLNRFGLPRELTTRVGTRHAHLLMHVPFLGNQAKPSLQMPQYLGSRMEHFLQLAGQGLQAPLLR